MLRSFIIGVSILFLLAPGLAASSATAIVWQGQSVGSGIVIDTLNTPRIGPGGEVIFSGFLSGTGITSANDLSLWLWVGALQLVCQEGYSYSQVGPGVTGLCPVNGALNAGGRVFGADFLSGPGVDTTNDTIRTLIVGSASSSFLVVREGDPAPGTDAVFDQAFGDNLMGSNDRVVFSSLLRGGSTTWGIWAGPATDVSLFVKVGDSAPELGGTFQGLSSVQLSDSGDLAFHGWNESNDSGLFRGSPNGGPSFVVGTDSAMPGGVILDYPASFALNNSAQIALRGALDSGNKGIWAASPDMRGIAIPGQPAPDFGSFTTCSPPSIGDTGDICFFAQTSVGGDGLFCEIAGILQTVVREDDSPPVLGAGETVGDLLWRPIVNASGQVLFLSQVNTGSGVDLTWWLRKTDGDLVIIARVGDDLEVGPGVFKTISSLNLPTGDYPFNIGGGNATAFNDRGEAVFMASFTDGSEGIFVGRPQPVLPDEIFRDGFEEGHTGAWSSSTP